MSILTCQGICVNNKKQGPHCAVRSLLFSGKLARVLDSGLSSSQTGDGHTEGRAGHVVQANTVAELDGGGIAAVLTADTQLQVGASAAAQLSGHLDQLTNTVLVQAGEGIALIDLAGVVGIQELAGVVTGEAESHLGQVVGAEGEELGFLGDLVSSQSCTGDLDHGADLVVHGGTGLGNQGVSLRPRATVAPVIVDNAYGELEIKRRVYYGRMMDFFVADLFEGLACGHYLWKCGYCGRYFLMTTAHRQLYCQTVAPGNRYPCSVLSKHHKTATEHTRANKQSKTDNPIYILYKQRDNSIRKDKSRGKYDADTCDRAKAYAKNCYERALGDPAYAQKQYPIDMVLENIYKNA